MPCITTFCVTMMGKGMGGGESIMPCGTRLWLKIMGKGLNPEFNLIFFGGGGGGGGLQC